MAAGAAGAAAGAALAQAIQASGVIVRVEPTQFSKLLNVAKDPLIVVAQGGLFRKNYQYLMAYRGLTFYTKSTDPLPLPSSAELVTAGKIWVPGG
jgi:hypothetical protein